MPKNIQNKVHKRTLFKKRIKRPSIHLKAKKIKYAIITFRKSNQVTVFHRSQRIKDNRVNYKIRVLQVWLRLMRQKRWGSGLRRIIKKK